MSEETVQEVIPEVDLEELARQYEEKGFFKRVSEMFKGLGQPKDTREYKLARIELQRLAAPLIAIVVPVIFVVVLIVVTAIQGERREIIKVDIAQVDEEVEEIKEEEEPPPPEEIEPPDDLEVMVDNPNPGPVSDITPQPSPPSNQVSVKPAPVDAVALVNSPVTMKSIFGSRNTGSIGAATRGGNGYGDANTEAAVLKVLWYLKAHQARNGSWDTGKSPAANTGFAILTYLAHNEYPGSDSPNEPEFGPVVKRAIEYLISQVKIGSSGCHLNNEDSTSYDFAIVCYALCEAYGMTKNPEIKEVALAMMDRLIKGQNPTGGWTYKLPGNSERDDVSLGGWVIQALKAGKMAGLHPIGLTETIDKAIGCLKKRNFCTDEHVGFRYTPKPQKAWGYTGLAGVGALAMQLLGRGAEPEVAHCLKVMREWQPAFDVATMAGPNGTTKGKNDPQYSCYYAAQCKYQAGMKKGATQEDEQNWYAWNKAMKATYPKLIKDNLPKVKDRKGKEHAQGFYVNQDKMTSRPIMDTCLTALQLMVYYRYLPTTQTAAGADDTGAADTTGAGAVNKDADVDVSVDI